MNGVTEVTVYQKVLRIGLKFNNIDMLHRIVLLLLVLTLSTAFAQTVVTWQSESIKDLRKNEEYPFTCTFNIYPDDRIDWVQGDVIQSFPVTSTEGALPEEGEGRITYNLMKEGKSGKVIVERISTNEVLLTLDLRKDTDLGAYYSFRVFNP